MSQVDLEIKLQIERFCAILDEAIGKSEVGIFLANVLSSQENSKFDELKTALSEREFEKLLSVLNKLNISSVGEDFKEYIHITEDIMEKYLEYGSIENSDELSEALNILHGNPKIKFLAKSMLLLSSKDKASLLYDSLKRLKTRLLERMNITTTDKLKKEMMHKNLEKHNKAIKTRIEDCVLQIEEQEERYQLNIDKKLKIIVELENQLEMLKNNYKKELKQLLLDSQEKNRRVDDVHEVKLANVIKKDLETEENYNRTLKLNVQREKLLRSARLEVEKDLTQCLEKYDTDIGEKQLELDILTEEYEKQKLQLEELQEKFKEQELVYIPCMEQKEAEYQEEVRIKMLSFLMEHAAKVIQRRWRRILASRAEKKRVKKLGAKKKKAKD